MIAWLAALVLTFSPAHHRHGYPLFWKHEASCIRYQESRGEWVAVLSDIEVVGPFSSLADADAWTAAQSEGDEIPKTTLRSPSPW